MQQQKYLFFFFPLLVCCCCTLPTCYPKYSCVSGAGKVLVTPCRIPWDGMHQANVKIVQRLSFNCQLCPCSWSQHALLSGLPIGFLPAQFCRNSASFCMVVVLHGTALNTAGCSSFFFFFLFIACLLLFCPLFLPPYCSFICTPFVPCLKAVSNVSVQGIHCTTTSQWKELPFRDKGVFF